MKFFQQLTNTLKIFSCWRVITIIFAVLATIVIPLELKFTAFKDVGKGLPYWFWIWGNFDGYHYIKIAVNNYGLHEYPFFPLFPVAIRLFWIITCINPLISALIISNICFLVSLFIIGSLLRFEHNKLKSFTYLTIILFPTAFYYGAVYNDSLYLMLASLSLLFIRQKRYLLSGLAASLATLARLNGLALLFPFFLELIWHDKFDLIEKWDFRILWHWLWPVNWLKRIIKWETIAGLSILMAFFGFLIYIHLEFGSYELVFSSMKVWQQDKFVIPFQVVWRYIKIFFHPSWTIIYFIAWIEFLSVVYYSVMCAYSWGKIRLSYWMFAVVSLLIPAFTGTFQGMPRYGLHLYPLFLMQAYFLSEKSTRFKSAWFATSGILLAVLEGLFTRGYFVS